MRSPQRCISLNKSRSQRSLITLKNRITSPDLIFSTGEAVIAGVVDNTIRYYSVAGGQLKY